MSLISSEEAVFREGLESLRATFGEVDFISPRLSFDRTDYYDEEMGHPLFRHFVTFRRLIPIVSLPEIKWTTNDLEGRYSAPGGKRRINIDPGYLCPAHAVLATTKAYTHRPYLRDGIYADLTLIFRDKSFQPLEWTYPDYRREEVIILFNQVRRKYLEELKESEDVPC